MRIEAYNNMVGTYGGGRESTSALSSDFQECMKARKLKMPENRSLRADGTKESEAADRLKYDLWPTFDGLDRLGKNAPDEVKEAWNKAEEISGIGGMAMNSDGKVTQLTELFVMSLENVYNGGSSDVLGSTVSSAKTAVQNALNRLGVPQNSGERKEKAFYEAFLEYLS